MVEFYNVYSNNNNILPFIYSNDEVDKAFLQFQKVLKIDEDDKTANYNLSLLYFEQKEFDKAKKHVDSLLKTGANVQHLVKLLENNNVKF